MARGKTGLRERGRVLIIGLLGMGLLHFSGCASEPPKSSAPAVTPEQVRSHADKAFDKLKQEERDRAPDPAATSY